MRHKILIVDDNPDDIEITEIVLAELGRSEAVETARSGEVALEHLRDGRDLPCLILLDLKMPGMSGIDTLRKIRADGRLKDIPIVVVTSSSLESDKLEAYKAGANSYLHKAFDADKFSRELNSLLEQYLIH